MKGAALRVALAFVFCKSGGPSASASMQLGARDLVLVGVVVPC
jgi:hypothetical protein